MTRSTAGKTVLRVDADTDLPVEAGSRACGLQQLMKHGLRVPATWVVLPRATATDVEDLAAILEEAGIGLLGVRSSPTDEVDIRFAFAGGHEPAPGVAPRSLTQAVDRVTQSAVPPRAAAYRRAVGLPPSAGPCAAIVQELVDARAAGVAFGPRRGSREIVIEAARGPGKSVVGGTAAPEVVRVRAEGDDWVVRYREATREENALAVEIGVVGRARHPGGGDRGTILSVASAREIAETVADLQWTLSSPLDLEWAESGGTIWWVQMRPQTLSIADSRLADVTEPGEPGGSPSTEIWSRSMAHRAGWRLE